MRNAPPISRRHFIASTSTLLAASQLGVGQNSGEREATEKLAVDGGPKCVTRAMPKPVRWGEPELKQLGEAVKQPSLINEGMDEEYIRSVAKAVRKVARFYAAA